MAQSARSEVINLRAAPGQKALIDAAAERVGKSRSEFMLDAARLMAEDVLLDQRLFLLDGPAFDAFTRALDGASEVNPQLMRTLQARAPWQEGR